jgi:hypothetical protein
LQGCCSSQILPRSRPCRHLLSTNFVPPADRFLSCSSGMPGPPTSPRSTPVSVRFTNDHSEQPAELLWHREMEGGLLVAQHLATVLPGRSRIIRSFAGHSFSMWQGDEEVQHWTMEDAKRQHYKLSSQSRVRPPQALPQKPPQQAAPTKQEPGDEPVAAEQPDQRLAAARQLAARGKNREALALFKSVGSYSAADRPKLAARIAYLERLVASEDMLKGRPGSTVSLAPASPRSNMPRCDKCTLPSPCGKVHAQKRTYAEVCSL